MGLDHERLDVYQAALEFVVFGNDVVEQLPRGRAHLADQLQRAATSVPLNIAEGAGEFSPAEKARFYRMARRSATESAAILDVLSRLALLDEQRHAVGRELLQRVVSMLTRLVKSKSP
jgi:four helix bundle protein